MKIKSIAGPVARYTRFVILGRNFLWVLVAGIVATIVWIATGDKGEDAQRLVFSGTTAPGATTDNEMLKPHYQGLDAKNNPYTVIADKAIQKDKDNVTLLNLRADIKQGDGKWLALTAGAGDLNIPDKQLLLMDGVTLFYDGGYEMETAYAQVDIGQGTAYGDSPVKGHGPLGTLQASRFEAVDRGRIIRFNGSVRLKIYR